LHRVFEQGRTVPTVSNGFDQEGQTASTKTVPSGKIAASQSLAVCIARCAWRSHHRFAQEDARGHLLAEE
jgi:hypothetical protein